MKHNWSFLDYQEYPIPEEWVWATDFKTVFKAKWNWAPGIPIEHGLWEDETGDRVHPAQWLFLHECPNEPPSVPPPRKQSTGGIVAFMAMPEEEGETWSQTKPETPLPEQPPNSPAKKAFATSLSEFPILTKADVEKPGAWFKSLSSGEQWKVHLGFNPYLLAAIGSRCRAHLSSMKYWETIAHNLSKESWT